MANEFKVKKGLIVEGSGGTILDIQGSVGQLFSITDSLTGDLFAVSDISGIPILNVNSSGAVDIDGDLSVTDDVTLSNFGAGYLKTNVNGVVSNTATIPWATVSSTPTTISGYGITDALAIGTTATTAMAGNTTIPTNNNQLTNGAGYITGVTNVSGYSGSLFRSDNRTISPSEETAGRMKFGFTSWNNNNTSPYADFLHLRSYTDSSGGKDNLVMFKKSEIGMRIWQQSFGSSTAYSSYEDVYHTGNLTIGDGGLTQKNFTTTLKDKLDGITASANNYSLPANIPATSVAIGGTVTLSESADRADLLYINSSTSSWGGLQVGNTSNEFIFSLMGNGNAGGIYDDQNGDWIIYWDENAGVKLHHNSNVKLVTTSTGITITGEIVTTGGNSTNWNTAYGWGNHASAGYGDATQDYVGEQIAAISIPSGNAIIDWTADQGATNIHSGNYINTTYTVGDGGLTQNNFTNADHTKLNGIETGATADQTAAEIKTAIGTGNGKLVPAAGSAGQFLKHDGTFGTPSYTTNTDTQLSQEEVIGMLTAGTNVTISAEGVIASTDTDTVYTHPTSAGNKHIPSGGAAGQFLRYSSSGTASWATPSYTTNTDTTYSAGTGLDLTGTTFSIEPDLRDGVTRIGKDTSNYIAIGADTNVIDFHVGGVWVARMESDGDLHMKGDVIAFSNIFNP